MLTKANPIKPPGYDSKPRDYFEQGRPEMLQFVPPGCKRVLDVGCSQGYFGESLKRTFQLEVWGIEPVADAAAKAATRLDHVIEGIFDANTNLPAAFFDVVFFNDVLEHLMAPATALQLARNLLVPGGVVITSIPNIRHFPTLWEVVVGKDWRYADSGVMDRTHLRFFTKKSILAMFADSGFAVNQIEGINPNSSGTARKWMCFRLLNALTLGAVEDMRYFQFAVVAQPRKSA